VVRFDRDALSGPHACDVSGAAVPRYAGEVGTAEVDAATKSKAVQDATAALGDHLDAYRTFFLDGQSFIGGDSPSIADDQESIRLPTVD
jgi:hypothetical protein